jgi:biopolymer transport protein ExbD
MYARACILAASALLLAGCGGANKCASEPEAPVASSEPVAPSSAPSGAASSGAKSASPAAPAPASSSAAPITMPVGAGADATLHVEIAKDGSLSIEGARLADPRELTERARASARVRPDLQVVIAADRDVPYGTVVSAIDLVRLAGVGRISFAVEHGAAASPPPAQGGSVPTLEPGEAWKCHYTGHLAHPSDVSVFVAIHVGPDGKPQTVDVLEDPGPGLGDAARLCAMNHTFRPAKDASGKPVAGVMKLRVYFQH